MHAQQTLFGRYAEPQREPVMTRSSMDVQAVGSSCPESVVGQRRTEEAEERPRRSDAQEPDLTTVRVTREDEIGFAFGQMAEGPRIMEHHQSQVIGKARVLGARFGDARDAIAEVIV